MRSSWGRPQGQEQGARGWYLWAGEESLGSRCGRKERQDDQNRIRTSCVAGYFAVRTVRTVLRREGRMTRTGSGHPGGKTTSQRSRRLASLAAVPVTELQGVGPSRARGLKKLGVHNILDLLWHVPRRYLDRSRQTPIAELHTVQPADGEQLTLIATIERLRKRQIRRRLTLYEATLTDETGRLRATWFNRKGWERLAAPGQTVACSGNLGWYRGRPSLEVHALEPVGVVGATGRIVPVHAASKEVGPEIVRTLVRETLQRAGPLRDPIPPDLLQQYRLLSRTEAFRQIHFPDDLGEARRARERLVYDELFLLEAGLAIRKRHLAETGTGISHTVNGPLRQVLIDRLPFSLTGAQTRALAEIEKDLASSLPMHRLLQGDVGSGKTVVAACALLCAVDSGRQAAIMAPTEVLAEQHYEGISSLLEGLMVSCQEGLLGERPLCIELLTNRTTGAQRRAVLQASAAAQVDILIGTHALIQEGVSIPRLGVAVIDEQHRFGVHQRVALKDKAGVSAESALSLQPMGSAVPEAAERKSGALPFLPGEVASGEAASQGAPAEPLLVPDVLIMTATPIPRTLSMTLYGDLDVSVLDELPPGRHPIVTRAVRPGRRRDRVYQYLLEEVAAGRQAYVICPLVEDSEALDATSAVAEYDRLREGPLAEARLGLLHGQMRSPEKHEIMARFYSGKIDVLVATTVVEVGVDVPNATVIVIEDADRFGLSQLHQLRGRVGRGLHSSICYLFCDPQTPDAQKRIDAMTRFTDGFALAEVDLEIRGEGSLFGARQSGASDLRVTRLIKDFHWVERAREDAFALVATDPCLLASRHALLREEVGMLLGEDVEWLLRS